MQKRGPLNQRLGANLRAIRLERGYTQEGWAERLGYDRTYVASLERGERNMSLDSLTALAEKLGIEPLSLLVDPVTTQTID
ncbi:helix-turn-helix domain-containing protein [Brevibacterium oceani]|uniref:helix-turn-helix domain-containing protein n=1 Tax=Brevibacterium oceani TaxID=358099 RepID=UPI001B335F44|nr:helix-turn-helix transcriptional regulator [Brevibacterium oceani]